MRTFEPEFKVGQLVKGADRFSDHVPTGRILEHCVETDWGKPEHYYLIEGDGAWISEEMIVHAGLFDRITNHPVYALLTLLFVLITTAIASDDDYNRQVSEPDGFQRVVAEADAKAADDKRYGR